MIRLTVKKYVDKKDRVIKRTVEIETPESSLKTVLFNHFINIDGPIVNIVDLGTHNTFKMYVNVPVEVTNYVIIDEAPLP